MKSIIPPRFWAFLGLALLACVFAKPANATPAQSVSVCITDYRIQSENARHSISGFGKLRDGRLFAWSVAATDMAATVGTTGAITPIVAGPGTGYLVGQEPDLVAFLETAARDGVWLTMSLDASTTAVQKVAFVARGFPQTGNCAAG